MEFHNIVCYVHIYLSEWGKLVSLSKGISLLGLGGPKKLR